jgi:hypothetical protein
MSEYKFNPNNHLMQLKSKEGSKDYLPVRYRLVWYREACPNGTIETEMVHLDLTHEVTKEISVWNNDIRRSEKIQKTVCGIAIFKATVKDGNGGVATGYGSESAIDFGDFIEKAETKSIGRALAALGYGTQFAPELDEGSRIVDAPVERSQDEQQPASQQQAPRQMSAPNTSKSRQNGASDPVADQQGNKSLSVKEYFGVVYRHALAMKQFSVSEKASDQEKIQAFLDFAGPVVGATLASAGHLTKSRLDDIEAYLNAKDAA